MKKKGYVDNRETNGIFLKWGFDDDKQLKRKLNKLLGFEFEREKKKEEENKKWQ